MLRPDESQCDEAEPPSHASPPRAGDDGIEPFELEDFLNDTLTEQFAVDAEDDSCREVAILCCRLHYNCSRADLVRKPRRRSRRRRVSLSHGLKRAWRSLYHAPVLAPASCQYPCHAPSTLIKGTTTLHEIGQTQYWFLG